MNAYRRAREHMQARRGKLPGRLLIMTAVAVLASVLAIAPAAAQVTSTEDVTPPALVSATLDATTVDATVSPQMLEATIHATDDLSGVQFISLLYRHETQGTYLSIFARGHNRVAGDALDGTYVSQTQVPTTTAAGDFELFSVTVQDTVGNYFRAQGPDVATVNAPQTITVLSVVDVTPPEIVSLTVVDPSIDVTTDLAVVAVEAVATDAGSGVRNLSVGFASPSRRQYASTSLQVTTGDPTLLRGAAIVAAHSEPGTWQLDQVCVTDWSNNSQCWTRSSSPTAFEQFGLALEVTSDFADYEAPEMTSYAIDPLAVDVTLGPEHVTVDFAVSDNAAGVAYAWIQFASPRTVGATPEVINRFAYGFAPRLYDVVRQPDGTYTYARNANQPMLNGTVQGQVQFPRYDRSGDWQIFRVCVVDNVNWITCYSGDQLIDLGPTSLEVDWNRTPSVAVTGVDAPSYPAGQEPVVGCAVEDLEDGVIDGVIPEVVGPDVDGRVTVTCRYTDSGGITGTDTASYIVEQPSDTTPPTLSGEPTTDPNANGWYAGPVTIAWTAADDDSGIDPATMPGDSVIAGDGEGLTASASVSDLAGNSTTATSAPAVSIDSVAPTVADPGVDTNPKPIGEVAALSAAVADDRSGVAGAEYFIETDPGEGSGTAMVVGDGVATATIGSDLPAGVHLVHVRSVDLAGNWSDPAGVMLVVYDPDGGFVTGGGFIDSPAGAYVTDPALEGRANFGFVAKYRRGANRPDGNTQFRFRAGDLTFHSTSYEWLVVSGSTARFKGEGRINGEDGYGFMLTACDADAAASCSGADSDTFRIAIWVLDTEATVYDNGGTALSGGAIRVHQG